MRILSTPSVKSLIPIRAVPPAEGESVRTRAAGQRVVSKAAREIVVAVVSEQRITAGAASNEIVPSSAMRHESHTVVGEPSGRDLVVAAAGPDRENVLSAVLAGHLDS